MNKNSSRRASIILGVFMFVVLIAGTIIPLITRNQTTTTQTVDPTTVPTPTYPPVIADYSGISFDKVYLHPTGMYTIPEPTGWQVSAPTSNAGIAQVNMINQTQLSVIDAYVQDAEGPISPEDLDARFTAETILATWSNFRDPIETNRSFENDILTIDFRVGLANGQTYVARQNVWTDGEWIYVVRVVVPENATETLRFLLSNLTGKITPFKQFAAEPFNWNAYYDNVTSAIIRYPQAWTVTDSAPGRPASITGTNGEALRVEARAGQSVADEAAASAWVEAERPGATVLSVAPVTRGDVSGFSVAYTYNDVEGAAFSGLAVLLNGANALYIANLHFAGGNVDLNTVALPSAEPTAEATELPGLLAEDTAAADQNQTLAQVMASFQILPALDLSASSLPEATPTAIPTIAPTVETTAEATAEATDAAPVETTPEATASS
jgi:hypothetical protein